MGRRKRATQQADAAAAAAAKLLSERAREAQQAKAARRRSARRTVRSLVWRWRKQLAPLAALGGLWAAGAAASGQPGPRVLACGLLGVAVVVWRLRGKLDRRAEQGYALACLVAGLVWLLAAARWGVGAVDVPLVAGWAAASVPWWRHHGVRHVAGDEPQVLTSLEEWWQATAASFGGPWTEARVIATRPVDNGDMLEIGLPPGKLTTTDAIRMAERVASAREGSLATTLVEPTTDRKASRFRITLLSSSRTEQLHPWPGPQLDVSTGLAPAGPYADAGLCQVQWWRPGSGPKHWLVTGATEGGKSRFMDWMLAESAHSGLVATWLGDPQGGQSLPAWRDRVHHFADNPESILQMLLAAVDELEARSRRLARQEWTDDKGRTWVGVDHFDPTPQMPILQVVVEEAQDILCESAAAVRLCERIAQKGRKCGVRLVLATHVPSVDKLGGSMMLRAQLASGNVICLRTAERVSKNMVLPSHFAVDPYDLPTETTDGQSTAGTAFVWGPKARPVPMRNYLVEDVFAVAAAAPLIPLDLHMPNGLTVDEDDPGGRAAGPVDVIRAEPAETPSSCRDAILKLPWGQQSELTRQQIHDALHLAGCTVGLSAVQKALGELITEGHVDRAAHGLYRLREQVPAA